MVVLLTNLFEDRTSFNAKAVESAALNTHLPQVLGQLYIFGSLRQLLELVVQGPQNCSHGTNTHRQSP